MIATITCALCGATVTNRQSLVIEPYGRICRSHPEVEAYQTKLAEERKRVVETKHEASIEKGIMRQLHIIASVSGIRSMAYIRGLPLDVVRDLVINRMPADERDEIRKELEERGEMTPAEFMGGLMMIGDLHARASKE